MTILNFKQNVVVNASEGGFAAMKSLIGSCRGSLLVALIQGSVGDVQPQLS